MGLKVNFKLQRRDKQKLANPKNTDENQFNICVLGAQKAKNREWGRKKIFEEIMTLKSPIFVEKHHL